MARRKSKPKPFAPVLTPAARAAFQAYGRALSRAFKAHPEVFQAWGAEGGKTRARRLTAEERRAIARKAARARWEARGAGS
jgi:hypothetical protein